MTPVTAATTAAFIVKVSRQTSAKKPDGDSVLLSATKDGIEMADPTRLQVREGDRVTWEFEDVPRGFAPTISFVAFTPHPDHQDDGLHPLGPHRSLERDGNRITAVVGDRGIGLHHYWFFLSPRGQGKHPIRLRCLNAWDGSEGGTEERLPPPRG